jgi:hypothetical protein
MTRERIEAWRAVANAKLAEFRQQRLAPPFRLGILTKTATVDRLWQIAPAHALVRSLGEQLTQVIIDEVIADPRSVQQEVA